MRGFRQWMSDHNEIVGILVFILIAIIVAGASYGISYAVSGASAKKAKTEQTISGGETESPSDSSEETTPAAEQPVPSAGSSSAEDSSQASSTVETTAAVTPTTAGDGTELTVGDTINEYGVYFQIVDESVTAKIETNLRRVPSTNNDEDIVATIYNGDWIRRTGIGHNGWSRVEYNGQVLYAVTSYLSTDGSSSSEPTYQDANDNVTAKEEVYLRTSPDSASESNIVATLIHGEYIVRIGIGSNGWSKLNYNGTEVYAVTSLLTTE